MSKNFMIWTMQRSGGTSFTRIVKKSGSYKHVLHEPFNGNQCFGHILRNQPKVHSYDEALNYYRVSIAKTISKNRYVSFKHCFEVHHDSFNQALFEVVTDMDYRQIVLSRKNNFERQVSLDLAKNTGIWDREQQDEHPHWDAVLPCLDIDTMIKHEQICRQREQFIKQLCSEISPLVVEYELLYRGGLKDRLSYLSRVHDYLEVEPLTESAVVHLGVDKDLMKSKLNSHEVYAQISNFKQARDEFFKMFHDGKCLDESSA